MVLFGGGGGGVEGVSCWLRRFFRAYPSRYILLYVKKGCLPKIEQQSTFQPEKLEKQVRSCAPSCLRAKFRGQPREKSFLYELFSNPVTSVPCFEHNWMSSVYIWITSSCMLKYMRQIWLHVVRSVRFELCRVVSVLCECVHACFRSLEVQIWDERIFFPILIHTDS